MTRFNSDDVEDLYNDAWKNISIMRKTMEVLEKTGNRKLLSELEQKIEKTDSIISRMRERKRLEFMSINSEYMILKLLKSSHINKQYISFYNYFKVRYIKNFIFCLYLVYIIIYK